MSLQVESASQEESTSEDVAEIPADICVVDSAMEARRVVNLLRTTYKTQDWFFACDTEVRPSAKPMRHPKAVASCTCMSMLPEASTPCV